MLLLLLVAVEEKYSSQWWPVSVFVGGGDLPPTGARVLARGPSAAGRVFFFSSPPLSVAWSCCCSYGITQTNKQTKESFCHLFIITIACVYRLLFRHHRLKKQKQVRLFFSFSVISID